MSWDTSCLTKEIIEVISGVSIETFQKWGWDGQRDIRSVVRWCHLLRLPYRVNMSCIQCLGSFTWDMVGGRHGQALINVDEWKAMHPRCWACDWAGSYPGHLLGPARLERHHMERKSQCHRLTRDWIENQCMLCSHCHAGPFATMPHAEQLAYKWAAESCGWATLEQFVMAWMQVKDMGLASTRRVEAHEVLEHMDKLGFSECRPIDQVRTTARIRHGKRN